MSIGPAFINAPVLAWLHEHGWIRDINSETDRVYWCIDNWSIDRVRNGYTFGPASDDLGTFDRPTAPNMPELMDTLIPGLVVTVGRAIGYTPAKGDK